MQKKRIKLEHDVKWNKESEEEEGEFSLHSSSYAGANVSYIIREKLGEAEISNFWHEVGVKKYITGLNISMHNVWLEVLMEEFETLCSSNTSWSSHLPAEVGISTFEIWKKICIILSQFSNERD